MTALAPTANEWNRVRRTHCGHVDALSDAELETLSIRQITDLDGVQVGREGLAQRLRDGMSRREACTTPAHPNKGKPRPGSLKSRCEAAGRDYATVYWRVRYADPPWSEEDALSVPTMTTQAAAEKAGRASAEKRKRHAQSKQPHL